MGHVRSTLTVTLTALALTSTLLPAEEQPAAREPLQVLADCAAATEAGDFERYVGHLSGAEQKLQAGYLHFLTRSLAHSQDLGASVTDPELFLLTRTMRDLVKVHAVAEGDHDAAHRQAEQALRQIVSETHYTSIGAPSPTRFSNGVPGLRQQYLIAESLLIDSRKFLIAALAEIARPTNVAGAEVASNNVFCRVDQAVKLAREMEWTLYTRGDYAVAMAPQRALPNQANSYGSLSTPQPRRYVEFQRLDGRWKITQLMPTLVSGTNGLARVNPYATESAHAATITAQRGVPARTVDAISVP